MPDGSCDAFTRLCSDGVLLVAQMLRVVLEGIVLEGTDATPISITCFSAHAWVDAFRFPGALQ